MAELVQCQRLARRTSTGLAWVGGGGDSSGDIFLAFQHWQSHSAYDDAASGVQMITPSAMTPLFPAGAEATAEAILNGPTTAETITGCNEHAS